MARDRESKEIEKVGDILKDLLITTLGAAGVKQTEIRKIVGCDMGRVNRIVKHIRRGE